MTKCRFCGKEIRRDKTGCCWISCEKSMEQETRICNKSPDCSHYEVGGGEK